MILRGLEISQSADNRVNFPHELQIFQDLHDLDRLRNHHDLQEIEDPPNLLGIPDLYDLQNLDIQDADPPPLFTT